jgi:hypothetical protein
MRPIPRTIFLSLAILAASGLLMLVPLAIGRSSINRFIVAFALVGVCWGATALLLSGWDWLRGR